MLDNVNLQVTKEDSWLWWLDSSPMYIVCSAYKFLNDQLNHVAEVQLPSFMHNDVPLKVGLFAWRLFCDRLSTKDNLFRRRVIDIDAQYCIGGCGVVESSSTYFYVVICLELYLSVGRCICGHAR